MPSKLVVFAGLTDACKVCVNCNVVMRASLIHHHRSRHLHHDDQCQTKQINYKPQFSAPDHQTH